MKKKIINCCVFLSFFSPAVTSLPFLWLLSFFIPPRCLLFWLFLATYLTLIYSQTHKIRKHTGKHAERACTAHQGDKASAASAFFIFKVSFCLKTALSCFFQTQLNIDVNSPPPLSSEQLTNKKKTKLHIPDVNRLRHTNTYRYSAAEAGSFDGRSGFHSISGLCWVTQLAWSPSGLHLINLYTAVLGAPRDRQV